MSRAQGDQQPNSSCMIVRIRSLADGVGDVSPSTGYCGMQGRRPNSYNLLDFVHVQPLEWSQKCVSRTDGAP